MPLTLAIKVASLKGTLRLHIKPPPSDRLWFGFTSMPDIDFNLESSVGERKINNGRIALLLISRFKVRLCLRRIHISSLMFISLSLWKFC